MSFDDALSRKIAARQSGPSPAQRLRSATQRAAEARVAPLAAAVSAMVARMSESAAFRALVGPNPEIAVTAGETPEDTIRVHFEGRFGVFLFHVRPRLFRASPDEPDQVRFAILVDHRLRAGLGGTAYYAEGTEVTGAMSDVEGIAADAEDFVAEFLADLAFTPLGAEWLAEDRRSAPTRVPAPALAAPPPRASLPRILFGCLAGLSVALRRR